MRILAVAVLPLLFLGTMCYEKPNPITWNESEETNIDTIYTGIVHGEWSYDLISIEGDTSELKIEYDYFGLIDSVYKDSVQSFIVELYTPYEYDGPEVSSKDVNDEFFRDYIRNFARQFEANDKESTETEWVSMVWSMESTVSINPSFASFCEVEQEVWSYEGGAHGNGYYLVYQF